MTLAPSSATAERHSLRSVLGGSTLVFSCRVIGAIATFGTQVLLARLLGADELGVYVLAFSWTLLLGAMGELGFGSAAIRFIPGALANGDAASVRGFLRSSCAAVAIGSAVFCCIGIAGALLLEAIEPTTRHTPFIIASFTVPLMAFMHLFGSIANGFGWMASAFIPSNVLRPVLAIAAMTVVWWFGHTLDVTSALLIQAGALFICLIGLILLIRMRTTTLKRTPPRYQTELWARTSLPLLVIGLFIYYFPDATVLVLGGFLPSDQVGVFNAAYRIVLFIAFGLYSVDAWFMPAAARLHAEGDRASLQRVVMKVAKLRLLGAGLAVVALTVFGRQTLGVFGEEFQAGYAALVLLALAQLAQAAVGPVTALLTVTGHQRRCLPAFASALGAVVLLIALLVPWFGIEGAAASVLAVTLGWSTWLHKLARDHLGIRPSPLWPLRAVVPATERH
jgi:O-antigen/teichoic acid export membrane protein